MTPTQPIKAILFDFVGVLINIVDVPLDPIARELDRMIGSVTDDVVFQQEAKRRFHLSEVQFDEYLRTIVNRFESFAPLWKAIPLLKKKYKLVVINNGTALTLPMIFSRFPQLTTEFDVFVSSAKEGIKKPDPEIYLRTCKKLDVQPSECLFMDDDKRNTDTAEKLGMQTIWWENHAKGFEICKKMLFEI